MIKKILKDFIVIGGTLLLLSIVLGLGTYQFLFSTQYNIPPNIKKEIVIEEGSGASAIANLLSKEGVVKNSNWLMYQLWRQDAISKLKPGTYTLTTGMNIDQLIKTLINAPQPQKTIETITITIPEGYRLEQTAKIIEEKLNIPQEEFLDIAKNNANNYAQKYSFLQNKKSLEGYLFPDTYEFTIDASSDDIINKMLNRFDEQINIIGISNEQLNEVLIIASIIEKETKLEDERPLVSSVIYNRLDINMPLQMCSTVVYALNKNEFRLTEAETKTDSPYNTYINQGLPPAPICSPGFSSLKAAFIPEETTYLYFVLTGKDGSQTFATTYEEFLAAKQKSKEEFGQ